MDIDRNELTRLVTQLKGGDSSAFEKIYNITNQSAWFTAKKIVGNDDDAEDVLQEAYIIVLNKIADLDKPETFLSWFNMIVANKAKDIYNKNKKTLFAPQSNDVDDDIPDFFESQKYEGEEFTPGTDVEKNELREQIMGLINNLSDEKRTAVVLFYYNNLTTKQIAESLGVNENTIKSRLVQAKKDLAKGVSELEKKNGKLLGVAPMPIVIWALKAASASSASSALTAAGITAAAGTAAATASAGAAAGGSAIAAKVIAGVVIAGIITGGTVAGTRAAKKRSAEAATSAMVEQISESPTGTETVAEITIPDNKNVEGEFRNGELKYNVSYRAIDYAYRTDGETQIKEGRKVLNRAEFKATYDELLPAAEDNAKKYSKQSGQVKALVNDSRKKAGSEALTVNGTLTETANVRAEEIAWSGKNSDTRPDGTSYTTVFDKKGLTAGSRYELRAYGCNSADEAVEKIKKNKSDILDNSDVTDMGIGVAENPETGELVYVIHLYSKDGSGTNGNPSIADRAKEGAVEALEGGIDILDRQQSQLDEFNERVKDDPILGHDFDVDWIFKGIDDGLDRLDERLNGTTEGENG